MNMDTPKIKVLTTKEKDEWNILLNNFEIKDIYYDPEYVKLFEEHQNEEARLFCYFNGDSTIIYPFFMKPISFYGYEGYFDISSTWFYGGPLIKGADKEIINDFLEEFHNYCSKNNIVTEFCRTHPLIKDYVKLDGRITLNEKWHVVYIDLVKDKENIVKEFKKECRKAINKAKSSGVIIERSKTEESIEEFYKLYCSSMERKGAEGFYFFSMNFLKKLFKNLNDSAEIFLARWKGRTISASILLHKSGFAHDFLRGYDPEFQNLRPNNLLVYEKIMWSKDNNYKYYVLQGGQDKNDGMARFKLTFSKTTAPFYTYNMVHNQKVYKLLCKMAQVNGNETYFPPYRITK